MIAKGLDNKLMQMYIRVHLLHRLKTNKLMTPICALWTQSSHLWFIIISIISILSYGQVN